MAIKPTNLKLIAKYAFSQAPSNLKTRLAGSGGNSRTGPTQTRLFFKISGLVFFHWAVFSDKKADFNQTDFATVQTDFLRTH